MPLTFAAPDPDAIELCTLTTEALAEFLETQTPETRSWIESNNFTAAHGQVLVIPDVNGGIAKALVGLGGPRDTARNRFAIAGVRSRLPAGTYRLVSGLTGDALEAEYLGWLLAGYAFDRYKDAKSPEAQLVGPDDADIAARLERIAAGEVLIRDLVNTPAADMGPHHLAAAAGQLAETFGASFSVVEGGDLKSQNFPMIHAVGRAAESAPRLIDMRWGEDGPMLTLVGKGVCFDTGGLNLKPGGSMALMKKDMGGAANVLGLAHMIMSSDLPVRLRVLIPAVENAVSGNAFRPGDILTSRKGLTVEINNTDAEGRLVLADALAFAQEEAPDLIISMATLTGAARVAVGPDLAPFYSDHDDHADVLSKAAKRVADPVWRMPFHDPYEAMIEPGIADLDNAPKGGFAGSITAALFLRRFVTDVPYMHFDIYSWQPSAAPARPKGGVGQGTRALFEALPGILDL